MNILALSSVMTVWTFKTFSICEGLSISYSGSNKQDSTTYSLKCEITGFSSLASWSRNGTSVVQCLPSGCLNSAEQRYSFRHDVGAIYVDFHTLTANEKGVQWTCAHGSDSPETFTVDLILKPIISSLGSNKWKSETFSIKCEILEFTNELSWTKENSLFSTCSKDSGCSRNSSPPYSFRYDESAIYVDFSMLEISENDKQWTCQHSGDWPVNFNVEVNFILWIFIYINVLLLTVFVILSLSLYIVYRLCCYKNYLPNFITTSDTNACSSQLCTTSETDACSPKLITTSDTDAGSPKVITTFDTDACSPKIITTSDTDVFTDNYFIRGVSFTGKHLIIVAAITQLVALIPTGIFLGIVYCKYGNYDPIYILVAFGLAAVFTLLATCVYLSIVWCSKKSEGKDKAATVVNDKARCCRMWSVLLFTSIILQVAWLFLIVLSLPKLTQKIKRK